MPPVTVVVADDAPVFRLQMARAVDADPRLVLVGLAADGQEALDLVLREQPDVVVLDVEMPFLDGPGVVSRLTELGSATRTVLLSSLPGDELRGLASGSGADRCYGKGTARRWVCAEVAALGADARLHV